MEDVLERLKRDWNTIIVQFKHQYDITDPAFRTWILPLKPISMEDGILYLLYPEEDDQTLFVLQRYIKPLQVHLEEMYGTSFQIQYVFRSEPETDLSLIEKCSQLHLNPRYTFDTFVRGKNNDMALAAAMRIATSPEHGYNPMFIYGGAGLGKTHLMHAIAQEMLKRHPEMNILYVTSEQFTNELIESIRSASVSNTAFRNKYRSVDVLLIDDIQFIIGKESTQEEFFHTFITLYEANKRIIISSDKPPKDFETLPDRLRSRFQTGIMTDIKQPNYEVRMAILQRYESQQGKNFQPEILDYIAKNICSNVRELEGAFNNLVAYSSLVYGEGHTSKLTLQEAIEQLKDMISPTDNKEITLESIADIVAEHYKVTVSDLQGKARVKEITFPRHVAMYLSDQLTQYPLKKIGAYYGGRDHSTIINAREKIHANIAKSKNFAAEIETIIKKIQP